MRLVAILLLFALAACQSGESARGAASGPYIGGSAGFNSGSSLRVY